nr:hypothetical protein CFP56_19529 [Quercus suber]
MARRLLSFNRASSTPPRLASANGRVVMVQPRLCLAWLITQLRSSTVLGPVKHPTMLRLTALTAGVLLISLTKTAVAVDATRDADLIAQLVTANSQLDRLALLPTNDDWLFDFTEQDKYTFQPGGVINMNAATFPAAKGNDMTRE